MGDIVDLKGQPTKLEENSDFISDCCRFFEGILSEANMKRKYSFADSVWERLGDDTALLAAVEEEKIRRIRSGRQKREKAQLLVVKAPDIASTIMLDETANSRHRLDAGKLLNDFASNGPEGAPAGDRFQITINLGADSDGKEIVEVYDKSIAIDVGDGAKKLESGKAKKLERDDQW